LEKLVAEVATPANREKSMAPLPLRVKDEVCNWAWVGKRKISEHVSPAYEVGMSKLKMLEMVDETCPSKLVPGALVGLLESMGMIRCGNWKAALRLVGQVVAGGGVAGGGGVVGGGGGGGGGQPDWQPSAVRVTCPQFVPPGVR
jgi:hypothetical protein